MSMEEHFKELLNPAAHPNTAFSSPDISAAEKYPCEVDPPSLEKVCTAVRQLRNNRCVLTPWAHGCIGRLPKFGCVKLSQITGVKSFFFLYSSRETSEYALIIEALA